VQTFSLHLQAGKPAVQQSWRCEQSRAGANEDCFGVGDLEAEAQGVSGLVFLPVVLSCHAVTFSIVPLGSSGAASSLKT